MEESPIQKREGRRLVRVEEGIFRYYEKDGRERFAVRFQHRGRDWRKFGFPTLTKSRLWRESRKGRAAEGRLFPEQEQLLERQQQSTVPFFEAYANAWLAACRARLKHSTLLRYASILRCHLVPEFGLKRLTDIDRSAVRQFVGRLSEAQAAPKTIHNMIRVLSAVFTQATEDQLVGVNPAGVPAKLVRVKKHQDHVIVFTPEEEDLVLQTAKNRLPAYYPFILLLFRTGLREGEAVALQSDDLNLRDRYLLVRRNFTAGQLEDSPKSGRTRKVDMTRDLVETLKEHCAIQQAELALKGKVLPRWLFTTPHGDMIRSNNFRDRVWRRLLSSLGLEYRTIHAIRHTFAHPAHHVGRQYCVCAADVGPFNNSTDGRSVYPLDRFSRRARNPRCGSPYAIRRKGGRHLSRQPHFAPSSSSGDCDGFTE
jgi:integrase